MLINICVALLTLSQGMILYLLLGLLPAISSGSRVSYVDENSKAHQTEQTLTTVTHEKTLDTDEHPAVIETTCAPVFPILALEPVTVQPTFKALDTSAATTLERAPPQIQIQDIATYHFVV